LRKRVSKDIPFEAKCWQTECLFNPETLVLGGELTDRVSALEAIGPDLLVSLATEHGAGYRPFSAFSNLARNAAAG
jgi:hypothetical protein